MWRKVVPIKMRETDGSYVCQTNSRAVEAFGKRERADACQSARNFDPGSACNIDGVDDARSRHQLCQMVFVEERIT